MPLPQTETGKEPRVQPLPELDHRGGAKGPRPYQRIGGPLREIVEQRRFVAIGGQREQDDQPLLDCQRDDIFSRESHLCEHRICALLQRKRDDELVAIRQQSTSVRNRERLGSRQEPRAWCSSPCWKYGRRIIDLSLMDRETRRHPDVFIPSYQITHRL